MKEKNLDRYSLQELYDMFPKEDMFVIDVVYGYLHKRRSEKVFAYCLSKDISSATLFRYIDRLEKEYNVIIHTPEDM